MSDKINQTSRPDVVKEVIKETVSEHVLGLFPGIAGQEKAVMLSTMLSGGSFDRCLFNKPMVQVVWEGETLRMVRSSGFFSTGLINGSALNMSDPFFFPGPNWNGKKLDHRIMGYLYAEDVLHHIKMAWSEHGDMAPINILAATRSPLQLELLSSMTPLRDKELGGEMDAIMNRDVRSILPYKWGDLEFADDLSWLASGYSPYSMPTLKVFSMSGVREEVRGVLSMMNPDQHYIFFGQLSDKASFIEFARFARTYGAGAGSEVLEKIEGN